MALRKAKNKAIKPKRNLAALSEQVNHPAMKAAREASLGPKANKERAAAARAALRAAGGNPRERGDRSEEHARSAKARKARKARAKAGSIDRSNPGNTFRQEYAAANPMSVNLKLLQALAAARAEKSIITPLDFMIWVLNAPGKRYNKKDKMWAAQSAAPYIHARRIEVSGDPARPIVVAAANALRSLTPEQFAVMRDISRKLNEKAVEPDKPAIEHKTFNAET